MTKKQQDESESLSTSLSPLRQSMKDICARYEKESLDWQEQMNEPEFRHGYQCNQEENGK